MNKELFINAILEHERKFNGGLIYHYESNEEFLNDLNNEINSIGIKEFASYLLDYYTFSVSREEKLCLKDLRFLLEKFTSTPVEDDSPEAKFNYQLLDRLRQDCDYYLGYGERYEGRLWAGNVKGQIAEMKKIWHSFSDNKKPEWLTYDQILEYEKLMA